MNRYRTRKETEAALGLPHGTLTAWRKWGCPALQTSKSPNGRGARYRYDLEEVREWMETRKVNRPALTTAETVTATTAEQKGVEA